VPAPVIAFVHEKEKPRFFSVKRGWKLVEAAGIEAKQVT